MVKVRVDISTKNLSESNVAPTAYIPDPIKRGKDLDKNVFQITKKRMKTNVVLHQRKLLGQKGLIRCHFWLELRILEVYVT